MLVFWMHCPVSTNQADKASSGTCRLQGQFSRSASGRSPLHHVRGCQKQPILLHRKWEVPVHLIHHNITLHQRTAACSWPSMASSMASSSMPMSRGAISSIGVTSRSLCESVCAARPPESDADGSSELGLLCIAAGVVTSEADEGNRLCGMHSLASKAVPES